MTTPTHITIRHAHLFCGLGGGARGFNQGRARVGNAHARFECLGGIDVDPASVRDFERLTGTPGTLLDLFDREQYAAFHGCEPPPDWREAQPVDICRAFGPLAPHILFLSPPCKGFSGLLSESKSKSGKYQALNRLTLRGIWLALEAYRDDPVPLLLLENVPRIMTRGRHLLDRIEALLRAYGYAVALTTHDCGELGGLAQSRKRALLVARHLERVPSFLYEPHKRPLKAVGEVLSRLPMPGRILADGTPEGGLMHRLPRLQFKTWLRLALVEAGSDWRSLNRLAVEDGVLRDYCLMPERVSWRDDVLGVLPWSGSTGTITGKSSPTSGRFAVADPRYTGREYSQYGILPWDRPTGAVSAQSQPGGGKYSVADPRYAGKEYRKNVYRVVDFDAPSGTVTAGHGPSSGGQSVADPRPDWMFPRRDCEAYENIYRIVPWDDACKAVTGASHTAGGALSVADPRRSGPVHGKYAVTPYEAHSGTVISGSATGTGAYAVADPRPAAWAEGKAHFARGPYGVNDWQDSARTVAASNIHDNSYSSVADPRLPEPDENCSVLIIAPDNTWHRPFTTLELAALQGLVDPEEQLELDGLSDSAWRERIGNAVPPPAAAAIAGVMGEVLILTALGETFSMSAQPIWVRPVTAALMAATGGLR